MLSYLAHALLDDRHGLVVNTCVTAATGIAEWDAVEMLLGDCHRGTVGGDRVAAWRGTGGPWSHRRHAKFSAR